jgi:hypothetical protein
VRSIGVVDRLGRGALLAGAPVAGIEHDVKMSNGLERLTRIWSAPHSQDASRALRVRHRGGYDNSTTMTSRAQKA